MDRSEQIRDIFESSRYLLSDMLPSEWAEQNRFMASEVSPFPGKFSFKRTPYLREPLDCLSPNHPAHTIAVMKAAQIGYALDIDTLIPTSNGMKKMLDIKVGDIVFDEKGKQCNVTKSTDVMLNHKCYEVHFTDGSIIKCDEEHLWTVYDLNNVKRTLNTKDISLKFKKSTSKINGRNRYYVYNTDPLKFNKKQLPIDPYLLGLWLGDGHTDGNRITGEKVDLIEYKSYFDSVGINTIIVGKGKIGTLRIRKPNDECLRGHKGQMKKISKAMVCYECSRQRYHNKLDPIKHKRIGESFTKLGLYGNKYIPEVYFNSSVEQRLLLLQGLIDSDGHIMKDGKVEFYNTNFDLITQVKRLIASLGYKVTIRKRNYKGTFKKIITDKLCELQDLYVLNFMGKKELPVARLSRKVSRLRSIKEIRKEVIKNWICDVVECDTVPVKCISVDSESHLYLVGNSYIPTHNSTGVIENAIGYIISQNPGNILFLTGHSDLAEEAMSGKIDNMIDSCGLRPLIRPNVLRKKNQRTGDTNKSKEFPGGSLVAGSAGNHKLLRQRSVRFGFIDDFDAAKKSTKESGNTFDMIQKRFSAYSLKKKVYYISTPEVKQTSNIEPLYLMGDQRKYFVPCPCCGDYIELKWSIEVNGEMRGITYKLDDKNKLIDESVGYLCQSCGGFFKETHKYEMNLKGEWRPTAEPSEPGFYSYHINSLYAPAGMDDWTAYVRQYLKANPINEPQKVREMQTFVNLALGETYEEVGEAPKANELQKNQRDYEIGTLPERMSQNDGNGMIVLLTCGADLNGTVDDARLDYEIVAWTESGASYSVKHGSIGTFVPRENSLKVKADRERWTYMKNEHNNVWDKFTEVIDEVFLTDTGRKMKIFITGVDTGHYTNHAYAYIESAKNFVVGLKGKDVDKYRRFGMDTQTFKMARERSDLYLVEVNMLKDELAELMKLRWKANIEQPQPTGYMNYPEPAGGLYTYNNYFSHFEAEHRIIEKNTDGEGVSARWVKKNSAVQNHLFDCRIYNMVLKDIMVSLVCKELKLKFYTWKDYVDTMLGRN